jgi:hypothetical protein
MDKRLYPISLGKFKKAIEPEIVNQYKRIGRPAEI